MRASEGGGIQGGTMGSPIGAFFWALFWRVPEKRHSYRPEKRYFCNLIIVLQDDISVIFLSFLKDNISVISSYRLCKTISQYLYNLNIQYTISKPHKEARLSPGLQRVEKAL